MVVVPLGHTVSHQYEMRTTTRITVTVKKKLAKKAKDKAKATDVSVSKYINNLILADDEKEALTA